MLGHLSPTDLRPEWPEVSLWEKEVVKWNQMKNRYMQILSQRGTFPWNVCISTEPIHSFQSKIPQHFNFSWLGRASRLIFAQGEIKWELTPKNIHATAYKNSYKEFVNEKKFMWLKSSPPPPPHKFFNGPSLNTTFLWISILRIALEFAWTVELFLSFFISLVIYCF